MKVLAAALATALLFASPAFAQDKPDCVTFEKLEQNLQPGVTVDTKMTGDELKRFNAFVNSKGSRAPEHADGLLVLTKPNEDPSLGIAVISTDGCVSGAQPIPLDQLHKLLELFKKGESV